MAYSTQRATSDGTLAYMDLSIGYIKRADISVFYDGLPADPATWAWAGTTDKRINFTPNIPNGVEVLLVRKTQINGIIHVFSLGAKFNNSTMDQDFTQLLYLNQEAVEGAALTDIFTNVDFHGNRIVNLGDAVDDLDAVNKRTVLALTSDSVDDAASSAADAAVSAGAAAGSATSSLNYANLARDWAIKMDGVVEDADYSSKYWAGQAAIVVNGTVPRTSATGSAVVPAGTTAQRDGSPVFGYARANSTLGVMEWWDGSQWAQLNSQSVRTNGDGSVDILVGGVSYLNVSASGVVTASKNPAFKVSRSAVQAVTAGSLTKLGFNTVEQNTGSYTVGTSRFQPNIPGLYLLSGSVAVVSSNVPILLQLMKNGVAEAVIFYSEAAVPAGCGSTLVYLNGTTDYVELFVTIQTTSQNVAATRTNNYFSGALIRPM